MANSLTLSRHQLHAACDAWGRTPTTGGGTLGLGPLALQAQGISHRGGLC